MPEKVIFRNPKYFKEFDASNKAGNACCWQLEVVRKDVEKILGEVTAKYHTVDADWGIGYSWSNANKVKHSFTIECSDVRAAEYTISYASSTRHLLIFRKDSPVSDSDFTRLRPLLELLNHEA